MKNLTASQVLKRMRGGELPGLKGGYTNTSIFQSDGATVDHKTMTKLLHAGMIEYPQGGSIRCRWTLAEGGK